MMTTPPATADDIADFLVARVVMRRPDLSLDPADLRERGFLDLGLDSADLPALLDDLHAATGVRLTPIDCFEHPTIDLLAAAAHARR
jgi:acyl carrier protein